jgi:hypothetical protein
LLRGDEDVDEFCEATTSVECGDLTPAMVAFRTMIQCTAHTLMPYVVAVTYVAYNVQCFPKAREPTVRAAKGFPPPFTIFTFHRPRWQGAKRRRGKNVLDEVLPPFGFAVV